MDISTRLDMAMHAAGFRDQSEMARAAGISQSTTNRILSGRAKHPDVLSLYSLARACKVSVEWLVSGEEPEKISVALAYITSTEAKLLSMYRQCDSDGKLSIFTAAEVAMQTSPCDGPIEE
ncbi:helix-turn-helix domain-containing protein [Undibacterium sp. MH2W]|uniref:helix-turn-helix domain-containing protein n=1 Tax=Undibacterium sp. MH2W TaxID=3413044 RepID=UPI003BF3D633